MNEKELNRKVFCYLINKRVDNAKELKDLEKAIDNTISQYIEFTVYEKGVQDFYSRVVENGNLKSLDEQKEFVKQNLPEYFHLK